MSPSAYPPRHLTASTASRRIVSPPPSGSTAPGVGHPEFEDFMNAYRPTLEVTNPKGEKIQSIKDESKPDFGRSLKRLMKRGQPSPGTSTKREGIHRTPLEPRERSVINELRPPAAPVLAKKAVRPSSVIVEGGPHHSPSLYRAANPPSSAAKHEPIMQKNSAKGKPEKGSSSSLEVGQRSPIEVTAAISLPLPKVSEPSPGATRRKISAQEQQQQQLLQQQQQLLQQQQQQQQQLLHQQLIQQQQQHSEKELIRNIQTTKPSTPPSPPVDSFCLLFTGDNLGRFLPPRRNPDVLLNMRAVEVPERKYYVIMEFDEGPQPQVPKSAQSGLQLEPDRPEDWEEKGIWEQASAFSCIRGSGIACAGMLLMNVERWTEFPFVTYLIVNGGISDLYNKVNHLRISRPPSHVPHHMHFTTGFEEIVTVCQPPFPALPERPVSDRTGFVVSLYQVLPGEDGLKFEQNWGTWTGARHLFYHAPEYMGLKRMSLHKSFLPSSIILYTLICEFSEIMEHITEACVLIDQLRAKCCGFVGIFRILDSL